MDSTGHAEGNPQEDGRARTLDRFAKYFDMKARPASYHNRRESLQVEVMKVATWVA